MQTRHLIDRSVRIIFQLAALISVLILLGIFGMLLVNGIKAFSDISVGEFFFSADWNPAAYGQYVSGDYRRDDHRRAAGHWSGGLPFRGSP